MTQALILRLFALLVLAFAVITALRVVVELNARVKTLLPLRPEICTRAPWHRDCQPYFGVYR